MREDDHSGPDLRALLERVESGEPTDAVEAVATELAVMVGARAVRFLIAAFSGRALVRHICPESCLVGRVHAPDAGRMVSESDPLALAGRRSGERPGRRPACTSTRPSRPLMPLRRG